ncbi:candidate aryl-alcohol dehydrogenase [Postia placenta Mad-698-R]|nr:candidate aryl-alcohol dehydrogenase [Postia placenta Mad-698-R]
MTSPNRPLRLWEPVPEPPTKLGRYRKLAPLAGIHVSPICLGAMSIGDQLGNFKLLDAFYAAGGNFIDTANNYQDETSEKFIGEWMETRCVRDQMVVATKVDKSIPQQTHYIGNNMKSLYLSVEASLKKLRTEYIDILYLHWVGVKYVLEDIRPNGSSAVGLGLRCRTQRKVLYLGISDTPAYIVAKANMYARLTGKTPFVIYQGAWSILQRDFEREIIPMVRDEGMALAPWNVLAAGKIRSDAEEERREQTGEKGRRVWNDAWKRTPDERKVCQALEKVAAEVNAKSITSVAIAYVMQKTPYVFPIVGGRKIEHLMDNIDALNIALSLEQIAYLEGVLPFDVGFPGSIIGNGSAYRLPYLSTGAFDKWPYLEAIRPAK